MGGAEGMKEQVLGFLKKHKYMTVQDGIRTLHTTELRHYISQLLKDGYKIGSEFVTNKQDGQRYKRYWLVKERKGQK